MASELSRLIEDELKKTGFYHEEEEDVITDEAVAEQAPLVPVKGESSGAGAGDEEAHSTIMGALRVEVGAHRGCSVREGVLALACMRKLGAQSRGACACMHAESPPVARPWQARVKEQQAAKKLLTLKRIVCIGGGIVLVFVMWILLVLNGSGGSSGWC